MNVITKWYRWIPLRNGGIPSSDWIELVHPPDLEGESKLPGLVNIQKAIEAMAIEIVDFPIKNGDFL